MILLYQISNWMSRGIDSGPLWPVIIFFAIYLLLILWAFLYGRIHKKRGIHLLRDVECAPASWLLLLTPLAILQLSGLITWASLALILIPVLEGFAFVRLFHANQVTHSVGTTLARFVSFQTIAALMAFLIALIIESPRSPLPTLVALLLLYGFIDLWRAQKLRYRLQKDGIRLTRFRHMVTVFAVAIPAFLAIFFSEFQQSPWLRYAGIAIGAVGTLFILVWTLKDISKFGHLLFPVILIRLISFAAAILCAVIVVLLVSLLFIDPESLEGSVQGIANIWILIVFAGIAVSTWAAWKNISQGNISPETADVFASVARYEADSATNPDIKKERLEDAEFFKNLAEVIRNRK